MQKVIKAIKDCVTSKTCCEETGVDCNQGRNCPVREGTHKPAEAVHQIQEPAPVTAMDALREAEAALEVAMARILKADPGHSISVTSEAKALVAVRAALAATAAVAVPDERAAFEKFAKSPIPRNFYSRIYENFEINNYWIGWQARAALAATPAANSVELHQIKTDFPVVPPETDAAIKDVMEVVKSCIDHSVTLHTVPTLGIKTIESKLRALLATGGQAQAVKGGE